MVSGELRNVPALPCPKAKRETLRIDNSGGLHNSRGLLSLGLGFFSRVSALAAHTRASLSLTSHSRLSLGSRDETRVSRALFSMISRELAQRE